MIGNICSGNIKNCKHVKHIQMKFSCICAREKTSVKTALMKINPQAQIGIPFEKIAYLQRLLTEPGKKLIALSGVAKTCVKDH